MILKMEIEMKSDWKTPHQSDVNIHLNIPGFT